MTLIDAGPLYALVDASQITNHGRCLAALPVLQKPLITTWPCFTEAMYLAFGAGGAPIQKLLWSYVEKGVLRFYDLVELDITRMQALMNQYGDAPMDLADASLVAAAEALRQKRVFTLDSHFHAYRMSGRQPFEVIP